MVLTFSDIPDEILSEILKYTLTSDTPMDLECFIGNGERPANFELTCPSNDWLIRHQPFCHYIRKVAGLSQMHLYRCHDFPLSQALHAQDWIIANSVSHRFRSWAKEAFFSEKVFVVGLDLLRRLQKGKLGSLSVENANLMIRHAEQIIVPLSGCSSATAYSSIPNYQLFEHLRVLTIWPGGTWGAPVFNALDSGFLREEVHCEIFKELLGNIGLNVDLIQLKVIRTAPEDVWQSRMECLQAIIFPHLRRLGEQKRKSLGERRT